MREPDERPDAGTILQARPLRGRHGSLKTVPPLVVDRLGKDSLLPAEALGHKPSRVPINRRSVGLRRQLAPPRLGRKHGRGCWGRGGFWSQQGRPSQETLHRGEHLCPRAQEGCGSDFCDRAELHAAPPKRQPDLNVHSLHPRRSEVCSPAAPFPPGRDSPERPGLDYLDIADRALPHSPSAERPCEHASGSSNGHHPSVVGNPSSIPPFFLLSRTSPPPAAGASGWRWWSCPGAAGPARSRWCTLCARSPSRPNWFSPSRSSDRRSQC